MSVFRIFINLFLLSLLSLTVKAQTPTYIDHACSNTVNFTRNRTYQSNLNSLLSTLSSNANVTSGFYNTTSGEKPNRVYGFFLCRGDLSSTTICQNCVTFATKNVEKWCPVENEVVIWYDQCLLRYSGEPNLFILSEWAKSSKVNPTVLNASYEGPFNKEVATAINDAATQAVSVGQRFATKESNCSVFRTLYSLVQCTPDMSRPDCNRCLQDAIAGLSECCSGKVGARVLYPKCYVRYEVYQFYATRIFTPPPVINHRGSKPKWIPITASLIAVPGLAVLSCFAFVIWRRRSSRGVQTLDLRGGNFGNLYSNEDFEGGNVGGSHEFPFIHLDIINAATNHFCDQNKLGEGGFGSVYKGTLPDGKEIAVKRLSRTSGQGLPEFKNEIMLIARLQHKNLVRLLGCCLEDNETLLVYEYMPNRSLDVLLFGLILELRHFYLTNEMEARATDFLSFFNSSLLSDSSMSVQLDWNRRFRIIIGIARGIMYFHEDSHLRIIHRDLKTSNILLDAEMNPKISDFGLARIIGGNQSEANTKRVVGTYGYMAPEYAMEGFFSVKSDVFSFGVLLLKIISGKKNNGLYFYERCESLLTYAWKLWSQGQGVQLIDAEMVQSCVESEVLKCIHIGLLCVQKHPVDRPMMSSVIVMLGGETVILPKPTEPAFFVGRVVAESASPLAKNIACSVNEVTLSIVSPR